jgi:starch synthase
MPSRYEPCGLAQMIAMRYGCVPLARATGGLLDTVIDIAEGQERGTGFLFASATPTAFAETLRRALVVFPNRERWRVIQMQGMRQDFSWENSALEYVKLYQDLILVRA